MATKRPEGEPDRFFDKTKNIKLVLGVFLASHVLRTN